MDNGDRRLAPGLSGEATLLANHENLASILGSGEVDVLATPMLVLAIEAAALNCIQGRLAPGATTVGARMDVRHTAPTPEGMKIRCRAELKRISEDGRRIFFEARAWDESGPIGSAEHERVIVDRDKFLESARGRRK